MMEGWKMKRAIGIAVLASCLAASAALATVSLPHRAAAEGDAGSRTLCEENFDGIADGETVGTAFTGEGGALVSADAFSRYDLPAVAWTYDWKVSFDVEFPDVEATGFLGINVNGLTEGVTYEFTVAKETGSGSAMYIKGANGEILVGADYEGQGGVPVIDPGTAYRYSVAKSGDTFTMSIDGTPHITYQIEGADRLASALDIYSFNLVGVKLDNLCVEKGELVPAVTLGEELYSDSFDAYEEGETVGNNLTATADGRLLAGVGFSQFDANGERFSADWLLSAEVTMPAERDGFFGFNIFGMKPDTTYEFTVQKTFTGGYALIKDGTSERYHSNNFGTNPVFANDLTYRISLLKVGKMFTLMVDGRMVAEIELSEIQTDATEFNFYTFNLDGVLVDNLKLQEVLPSTQIDSVTLSVSRPSISTMQSAEIKASVLPATAKIETVEWKVDGVTQEGAEETTFMFSSQTVGSHTIVCTINGVDSAPVTVEVTEASDEEKNSLYYETFDATPDGTKWGSFDIRGGAAYTNANYNRYDFAYSFVRDFDISFDVTWKEDISIDSYVGLTVTGLTETANEVEFNIHNAPETVPEEGEAPNVDNLIVKYNGTERWFSNDPEKAGRLDSLTIETGKTYTYHLIRYDDQFELYIDGMLAIKYYIKDSNSDPLVPAGMFLYTYNDNAAEVAIDNVIVRTAEEITDRVEPPVVEVTGAYVTASSVAIRTGESTTLTVQSTPFDATVTSYAWYINDVLVEGATEKSYTFTAEEAGEYEFKCVVNGTITSESKTVTVSETSAPGSEEPAEENLGLIIGLSVAGGVVVLVAAGIVIWRVIRKRRN